MTQTVDTKPSKSAATPSSATPRSRVRDGGRAEQTDAIIGDFRAMIGAMKCAMSERLVRLGISTTQLHIMYTLQRNGVMTMSQLADVLDVSFSNATGLIDRMEERGYVERTRVPEDRRIVLVRVSETGQRTIEENDALSEELMREVLGRLDSDALPVIAGAMAEVRKALEATTREPARNLHETSTGGAPAR